MALSQEALERIRKKKDEMQNGSQRNTNNGATSSSSNRGYTLNDTQLERIKKQKENMSNLRYSSQIVDQNYISSFFRDSQDFLTNADTSYKKLDYKTAIDSSSASYFDTLRKTENDLKSRARIIQEYLGSHRSQFDDETFKNISDYLNFYSSGSIAQKFYDARDYYAGFKSEDDYNKAVQAQKDYEAQISFDMEAGQKEIDDLSALYDEFRDIENKYQLSHSKTHWNRYTDEERKQYEDRYNELVSQYENPDAIWKQVQNKKAYLTTAGRAQDGHRLASVADPTSELYDPNFQAYVEAGKDLDYEAFGNGNYISVGKGPTVYSMDKYRAAAIALAEHSGQTDVPGTSNDILKTYRKMKDDEFNTLAYYLAKDQEQGTDLAKQYVDSIEEALNIRRGTDVGNAIGGIPVIRDLYGVYAGLDQFVTGASNLFSDEDYYITTPTQAASAAVREKMEDVDLKWFNFATGQWNDADIFGSSLGQVGYDLITTTANMAPSILASAAVGYFNPTAGAIVGNTLMGASAAGNAYADAINRGFDKNQAATYGVSIGVSEALLQQALGGIGKLGGSSAKIANAVSGIDKALLRFSAQYGGKIASEALEEGLQEILDPIFQNAIFGTDESINWEEVAYSALLGGLSAGVLDVVGLDGQSTAQQIRMEQNLKKQYGGNTDALIQEGLGNDVDSESYQLATKYKAKTDAGKTLTGAEIRNILAANQEQIKAKDIEKIKSAAAQRLTNLGETKDVATIAELATKRALGQRMTPSEKSQLARSQYGAQVAKELLPESIDVEDIDTSWAEEIGTEIVNHKAYNKQARELLNKITESLLYKPLEKRMEEEKPKNVSSTGKAVIRATGEEIDLTNPKIKSITKDDVVLDANGKDVNADEIDFATDEQWYAFNAIKKIEHITPDVANSMIANLDMTKPIGPQLNGMDEAFSYGIYKYSETDLKAGLFAGELTDELRNEMYNLGRYVAKNAVADNKAAIKKMRTAAEAEAAKQAESGTVLNETGETVKVKAIASKEGGKMTLELENGEIVDADKVTLSEDEALILKAISEMDISAKEANKLLQGYDGSISAEAYASGISEAYNYGRQGVAYKSIDSQGYAAAIPVQARKTAYQMGRKALETEKDRSYNSTTNEKERVSDGTGENVHLRRGTQRTDSESSDRSVRGMEETPGGVQKRNEAGRSESNRSDSQAHEGRVNAGDLGIPGGTGARNLTAVSSDYSADTKEAADVAAEQGLEAVFFTGDNLRIEHEGKVIEARACIAGKKIYVRADHPDFTATQLTKHELTHDKIDSGQIDTGNVYGLMVMYYGEAKVKDIIQAYAEAYDMGYDTQEAADAVFVEIVCDSEAGINYFTMEEKAEAPDFMKNVKHATQLDMNSRDTRGPPADGNVRLSRASRGRSIELETMENNRFERLRQFHGNLPAEWYAYTRGYFYIYSNQSYTDYTILAKVSITSKNRNAINDFTEALENGTYEHSKTFDSWTSHFRRGKGRYSWDSIRNGNRGTAVRSDGMDGGKRGSKNASDSKESGRTDQKVKFSREATEAIINQSMTMQQAKDMVQRAFVTGQIKEFYDGQYRNGDEWLAGEGVDEVAFYIENEYSIVNKYLNHIQEYIDEDIVLQDILNAYLSKTLTGKVKQPTQWLDLSHNVAVADKRFYAPKAVEDATAKLEVAKQRITNRKREEVTKARAEILLYAHNKGAAETLGLTEAELNRLLRTWSGYRSEARDISRRINSGVALSNRWSGIENCSWLSKAQVSEDELARLVKSVSGDSRGFERNYIARTMLALDTHIDWSDINFVFTGVVDPNRRSVRGTYNHRERTIKANYSSPDTVAHEMGHALDHKWANELGFSDNVTMTEGRLDTDLIKTEEQKRWYSHFQEFIRDLTDSADISSSYTMDNGEVFARFVSTFVQWADQTATGKQNYGYISSGRADKFTGEQYITFVKLLQEKAMIDSKAMASEGQEVKFSREFSLSDLNRQINELTNKRKEIVASAEYDRIVGKISTATGEALDAAIQEYKEFTKSSGLYDVTAQLATLEKQAEETRKRQEAEYQSKADSERKAAIEASGLTEAEYDTKQAVKEFGYTPYYYDAGYIVANGKLLNFSGEKGRHFGSRGQDHRAIGIIYDSVSGTQAMVKFMNEGNIRIMDESPGLDISTMPTKEQMATIKKYVASKHGEIYLDISDTEGRNVASIEYDRGTYPSIVELDIKEYFEKGKIPKKFEPKFSREFVQAQMTEQEKHLQQVNKALEKDNAKLQEDNQYLKQLLKLQREVTGGTKFTKSSVETMARQLKTKANASGETKELATILNSFYEFIATSKELTWEDVMEKAQVAADWLMENKREDFVRDEYAQRVLDDLWGRSFYLDDVQKGEAAYAYGSYQAFRQKVFGTVTASDKANMSLDELWKEMSADHPYYFPAETTSGDQVQGIVDVINTLRTAKAADTEAMFENSEEMEKRELLHDVYDSFWRVSTLRTVADAKQREINSLKAKHYAKMDQVKRAHKEATKQLEAEYRQRMDALRAEYKARTEEKIRKVKDANREARQKVAENRHKAEMRKKIRKTIRDLNKILNRGNKKQNVKEDMQGFVSKALELADYLFTDHITNDDLIRNGITVRMTPHEAALVKETEDILNKLYDDADSLTDEEFTRLDAKRKANEEKLRDLLNAQRNERLKTPVYDLFNDLITEYASFKNSKQDAVKAAYNADVERFLRSYIGEENGETDSERKGALQNMRVADMTTEELWKLLNAYQMVLHSVRNANKLFVKGKTESIEQVVTQIVSDFGSRKIPEKKMAIALQKLTNKIGWDYEKLYYALDRIGSEAFAELIMNIANSENIVMEDVIEAALFRDQIVEQYGFNNWDVNKKIDREFLDNTGKKFTMTLGQLMSLYAYSRRKGAWDHIEYGGFVFGEAALTDPKPADSYKLSKEQCEAITNTLTAEQKAYVEDMQKFLSETMGAKGNEVSMQLYGIKMFTEEIYFPIHIAGQFKAQAQESQAKAAAGFGSMSNAGFTHAQNPNAKAPFVLEGFNEVWADHVNEMSRYHGTVPALEDLRRVMNRSSYSEATAESTSVKVIMENHFGKEAVEYFDNLYREANSGAITDKLQKKSHKLLSLFRKNSVAYSLSVLVQQPASLVRAYAMVDRKYFGFHGFGTITSGVVKAVSNKWTKAHTKAYNEMLKYAPGVTMAKEIGGFDTHTGGSIRTYLLDTKKSFKQKWKTENALGKGKAILDVVDDNAIANLPNMADKIAWTEIWNACKRETVATHKDLAVNSEEFMQAVGERFTEVIRATQVYDSIFAKSPMLKSKNLAVQYLVSFMNEPNAVANMAESAVRDTVRGNWKGGLRKSAVLIHSIIFTGVLKSIIYAMRDDDEDETYIEKYIESLTGSLMDDFNALNYIPLVRDAWSVAQGYDVERADMAIVSDAVNALNAVIKNATTQTEDMTEDELIEFDKKVTDANWKLVGSLAAFLGIPIKNIRREVKGVIDHAKIASSNAGKTTNLSALDKVYDAVIESIPFMSSDKSKTDKLYNAIVNGDTAYANRIKSTYKTEDAYQSAVRKALRENDSRIHAAAQAKYEGRTEEYKRIFREIQNEGRFRFDDIMSAINSEETKIRTGVEPDKATSSYSASSFVEAIVTGNRSNANAMKADIISVHMANGKTKEEAEKEFASAVGTAIGDAYSAGLLRDTEAKKMLQEYAGKDEEEATSRVNWWVFREKYPKYKDVYSESHVEKFNEFAKPAGISVDVYAKFITGTKGLGTIRDEWDEIVKSKREQVLEVIDSLPLTWQQKDALYLAAGYSESKIWDVPW